MSLSLNVCEYVIICQRIFDIKIKAYHSSHHPVADVKSARIGVCGSSCATTVCICEIVKLVQQSKEVPILYTYYQPAKRLTPPAAVPQQRSTTRNAAAVVLLQTIRFYLPTQRNIQIIVFCPFLWHG